VFLCKISPDKIKKRQKYVMPSIKWLEARRKAQAVQNLGHAPITPEQEKYLNIIGRGAQGSVFEGRPGQVVKYETAVMPGSNGVSDAEVQHIAANLGIAPRVDAVYTVPSKDQSDFIQTNWVDRQIVQQDTRDNYQSVRDHLDDIALSKGTEAEEFAHRALLLQQAKQLGSLNLQGHNLTDRYPMNSGNLVVHKLTNRPMQLDFGFRDELTNKIDMAGKLAENVKYGLINAGLEDEGSILEETVSSLISNANNAYSGGNNRVGDEQAAEALNVAKQGLGVLQKIKKPLATPAPTLLDNKPKGGYPNVATHLPEGINLSDIEFMPMPELTAGDFAGHTSLFELQKKLANMRPSEKQRENMRDLESQRKRYGLNSQEMPF